MASYPVNITLASNTAVILEITDDAPVDAIMTGGFQSAYVRQLGALVTNCDLDDNVYYNIANTVAFKQGSGTTFVIVEQENILFVQDPLP